MDIKQPRRLLIEHLSVARGERVVLVDVSLRLCAGEIAEVTGSNGVGKSTLLRAIAGFLPLASGRTCWKEEFGTTDPVPLAERLHYVGHLDGLKSALTARENLELGLTILGRGRLTPSEALDRLKLAHILDLPVGYLSAGQRRRVALARLLGRPSSSMAARRTNDRARPARTGVAENHCSRPPPKRRFVGRSDARTTRPTGNTRNQA